MISTTGFSQGVMPTDPRLTSVNAPRLLTTGEQEPSIWDKILAGATNLLTTPAQAASTVLPSNVEARLTQDERSALNPKTPLDATSTLMSMLTLPLAMTPLAPIHGIFTNLSESMQKKRQDLARTLIEQGIQERGGEISSRLQETGGKIAQETQRMGAQQTLGGNIGLQQLGLQGSFEKENKQSAFVAERQKDLENLNFEHAKELQRLRLEATEPDKATKAMGKYLGNIQGIQSLLANYAILGGATPESRQAKSNLLKVSSVLSTLTLNEITKDPNMGADDKAKISKILNMFIEQGTPSTSKDILLSPTAPTKWEDYKGK